MNIIREIESRAIRAMPATETFRIEEWIGSLGRGAVGRLNSVTTFGTVPYDLFASVESVEHRYRNRSREVSFRLTELDAELDDLLWARGYEKSIEVSVMSTDQCVGLLDPEVTIRRAVTAGWVDDYKTLNACSELRASEIRESLSALDRDHALFSIETKAIGLAVYDSGWVGIFDVVVDNDSRRRGLGTRIVQTALAWGSELGAEHAYLQVVSSNTPAICLYQSLGFTEAYRYWYQRRD